MDRTPAYVGYNHGFRISEKLGARLEANIVNLFNQASVISRTTQPNRAGAIDIPVADFFKGYDPNRFVAVGGAVPCNPIYNLPGGDCRAGGTGASQHQPWRSVSFLSKSKTQPKGRSFRAALFAG